MNYNRLLSSNLCFAFISGLLIACSHSKPTVTGKRVNLVKGNISFVLPDSSLAYSKPFLWPADYSRGDYGEAGAFYHNQDSTFALSVYVKAYPDSLLGKAYWRVTADEREQRQTLLAKNRGLAVIERYKADSLAQTVEIDYHIRKAVGWRDSYNKSIVFYGHHRTINFWFSGPDNPSVRQQFTAVQTSIQVAPAYLQDTVPAYQSKAIRD